MRIYIDMDDTLCKYTEAFETQIKIEPKILFPQSQYGFFANLEPIEGAIDAVKSLIISEQFDPYILTAPSVKNPLCYSEKRVWIEHHFDIEFCDRLIICANKELLRGDVLIDDRAEGKGQESFEGKLIQFGSAQFPDWNSVLDELKKFI